MCKLLNEKSFLFAALLLSAISMSCSKDPEEADKPNKPDDHNIIEWGDSTLSGDATMGEMMMFRVGDSLQVIRKASTRLSTAFDGQNYTLSGDERITIALKRSDNSVEGPKIYKVKNVLTGALEYVKDADNNVTEPFYWKSKSETVRLRAWSYGTSTDYTTDPVGNAFSLNTDQREATGQDNYQELLYTPEFECKYTDHSGSASINLYHQMTRLTIDLTHLATGDLSVSQVTIGDGTLPTIAKFSETGIDTGNGDYIGSWEEPTVAEGTSGYVIARADQNNKKYSAVLFPKTYAAGTKLVTIKTTNGDFAYKIPAGDGLPLDPGKQYAYTISVTDLVETSTLSISDIDAYTYDGTAKEPHPIVKYGDKVLTEGTHYTLSWSNNINAGTATCTVTGKDGSIFKNSQDKNFTINKKAATISFANATLTKTYEDADFTVTVNNTGDGTVTYASANTTDATVGSGNGTVSIKNANTTGFNITATVVDGTNYTYATKTASYKLTINRKALDSSRLYFASTAITRSYIWELATGTNALTKPTACIVTYSSSDPSVATVNSNTGALTPGGTLATNTTITATATGNYSGTATYTIKATSKEKSFSYINNTIQSETVCKGTYQLEVWGAQGGNGYTTQYGYTGNFTPSGGKGGYSKGSKKFNSDETIFVVVGGAGETGKFREYRESKGGYNGGGNSGYNNVKKEGDNYGRCGAGGGATHMGLKTGLLTGYSSDYATKLLLVAGGGGGASVGATGKSYDGYGGSGGGTSGGKGGNCEYDGGLGGGQSSGSGNAFGLGGTSVCSNGGNNGGECPGGGGGGGFYGGHKGNYGRSVYGSGGGGGSGYIGGVSGGATYAGNTSFVAPGGGNETGHAGDGYARITWVSN